MNMNFITGQFVSKTIVWLILCIAVTSCQRTATVRDSTTPQQVNRKSDATSGLETARAGTSLRQQAAQETDKGQYQRASRLLERALRVDSRDPATYYEFARLRCLEASPERAVQLIEKGLTFRPDAKLRTKFSQLRKDCAQTEKA